MRSSKQADLLVLLIIQQKSFFHSDFLFPCFDVPKTSHFTYGGEQNCETKNRGLGMIVTSIQDSKPCEKQVSLTFSYFLINNVLLYHFLAYWLAHNKKMTEKSVFCEAWSPELATQLFLVSWFGVAVLYPTGSEIWRFWHVKTQGRKIAIDKIFLLHLSADWGDLCFRYLID